MATREQLKQICETIVAIVPDTNSFVKRTRWGRINFEDIKEEIETLVWLVREIQKLPPDIIHESIIDETLNHLSVLLKILMEIRDFDIKTVIDAPVAWQENISKNFKERYIHVIHTASRWLPLLVLRSGKIENLTAKMQDANSDITEMLQSTEGYMEERKEEIEKIMREARAVAGGEGAAKFTKEFSDEAEKARKRSIIWLGVTGAFSYALFTVSLLIAFNFFDLGTAPDNPWEALYRLGARVFVISTLFYIVVWSGRIVLANMHLENVNQHRAVSLQTLQAFHVAAENPAVKDAVTLEAARAVYENVPSGYIRRQGTEQSANIRMVESIKSANKAWRTRNRV